MKGLGLGMGVVPDERGVRVENMKGNDVSKTTEQQTLLKIPYHCCSRSRSLFAEAAANPASSLGCCALQTVSSAAIGWHGDTRNHCSCLTGQSGPSSLGKPRPH